MDASAWNHTPRYRPDRPGPLLQFGRCRRLEWNAVDLPIDGLPPALDGFRILHLSDLHLRGRWESGLNALLARTVENPPHLIAMTGDYVDATQPFGPSLPHLRRLFSGMRSVLGIFGILGNHDSDILPAYLPSLGIVYIGGRRVVLDHAGQAIELIGLPGAHRRDLDDRFFPGQPARMPGVPRIILSHFPDQIRRADGIGADLYLAGHTHGGQVCLPGRRPILRHDRLPRRYAHGVHRWNGHTWMVVHRGMGFSLLPIRLLCPAEVVEITLRRATGRAAIAP